MLKLLNQSRELYGWLVLGYFMYPCIGLNKESMISPYKILPSRMPLSFTIRYPIEGLVKFIGNYEMREQTIAISGQLLFGVSQSIFWVPAFAL